MENNEKEITKEMAWTFPEGIDKDQNVFDLEDSELEYYHDQMHVFWSKKLDGYYFDWNLKEIYKIHREVILNMLKRGIRHLHPIDSLDKIYLFHEQDDVDKILKWVSHKEEEVHK